MFTKKAALFRKVVFRFGNIYAWDFWSLEYAPMTERDKFTHLWKMLILALVPMINSTYLEFSISDLVREANNDIRSLKPMVTNDLKSTLLASVLASVRRKNGHRGRGIWFPAPCFTTNLHNLDAIGISWKELGVNLDLEPDHFPWVPTPEMVQYLKGAQSDPNGVRRYYYG